MFGCIYIYIFKSWVLLCLLFYLAPSPIPLHFFKNLTVDCEPPVDCVMFAGHFLKHAMALFTTQSGNIVGASTFYWPWVYCKFVMGIP